MVRANALTFFAFTVISIQNDRIEQITFNIIAEGYNRRKSQLNLFQTYLVNESKTFLMSSKTTSMSRLPSMLNKMPLSP